MSAVVGTLPQLENNVDEVPQDVGFDPVEGKKKKKKKFVKTRWSPYRTSAEACRECIYKSYLAKLI